MIKDLVAPPLREKKDAQAKCKVGFVEEKSVIYNIKMIQIDIIMTLYEFYKVNWKVA